MSVRGCRILYEGENGKEETWLSEPEGSVIMGDMPKSVKFSFMLALFEASHKGAKVLELEPCSLSEFKKRGAQRQ